MSVEKSRMVLVATHMEDMNLHDSDISDVEEISAVVKALQQHQPPNDGVTAPPVAVVKRNTSARLGNQAKRQRGSSVAVVKRNTSARSGNQAKRQQVSVEVYDSQQLAVNHTATRNKLQQTVVGDKKLIRANICSECKKPRQGKSCTQCGECKGIVHNTCLKLDSGKCKSCASENPLTCIYCRTKGTDDRKLMQCEGITKTGLKHNFHERCKEVRLTSILNILPKEKDDKKSKSKKLLRWIESLKSSCASCNICHTCIGSDNFDERTTAILSSWSDLAKKMLRCRSCPAVYHNEHRCLPAGSKYIGGNCIECPLHNDDDKAKKQKTVHLETCLVCKKAAAGDDLLRCDRCPTAAHQSCDIMMSNTNLLGETAADGRRFCPNCKMARQSISGAVIFYPTDNQRWKIGKILPMDHMELGSEKQKTGVIRVQSFGEDEEIKEIHQTNCLVFNNMTMSYFNKELDNLEEAMTVHNSNMTENLRPPDLTKLRASEDFAWAPVPVSYRRTQLPDAEDDTKCGCQSEQPCTRLGNCMNAALLVECTDESCELGDKCGNRSIQKRIVPKLKLRKVRERGLGLIACEDIYKGTFIGEYTGEIIDRDELKRRKLVENGNFYHFEISKGINIDANPCGNHTRFLNHSCDANTNGERWGIKGRMHLAIYSSKDIKAGDDVTLDYMDGAAGFSPCYCGTEKCRKPPTN